MDSELSSEKYVAKIGRPIKLILDDSTAETTASTDSAKIIKRQELEQFARNGYSIKILAQIYDVPYTTFHSFLVREGVLDLFTSRGDSE